MAGRHAGAQRRRRAPWIIATVTLVVLTVAGLVVFLRPAAKRAAAPPPPRPRAHCSSGVGLQVLADPSIAAAVDDLAARWTAAAPIVDGACPTVTVTSRASAAAAGQLRRTDMTLPQLWIPDSTLWVDQVRHDTTGTDSPVSSMWINPVIATSPLVLATTPSRLTVTRAAAARGWTSVLTGSSTPTIGSPTSGTEGLATVLTAQALLNGNSATPNRQLIDALVRLASRSVDDGAAVLDTLAHQPNSAAVTSERAVLQANANASAGHRIVAAYPSGRSVGLDWPVVQFAPPGGDPAIRDAASAFVRRLSTPAARHRFAAAGLRDPSRASRFAAPAVRSLPRPSVDRQTEALRAWSAASRTSRTLVVIDLSGSMSDTIGGGQTKIQFAAAAEQSAINFFPDTSSLGLWGFSVDRTRTTDWTELVPLGPLGDRVGHTIRRQALISAGRKMPSITRGATGLYTTALAAFDKVRSGYDPASVNTVVLLTDGANTDTRGIDLVTLLSRLRRERDRKRPLPIITIAVGHGADTTTLKRISAATGGRSYVANRPDDIQNALLDAIIKAG